MKAEEQMSRKAEEQKSRRAGEQESQRAKFRIDSMHYYNMHLEIGIPLLSTKSCPAHAPSPPSPLCTSPGRGG